MQWRNGHGLPNPRVAFRVVCRRSVRNIGYPSLISTSGSLDMHQASFFIVVIQGDVNLIGRIYIIKNQVNDKVYIGRTTKRVEERFKQHIRDARSSAKSRRKLINAIRELGEDKFWVEQLEEIEFYSNELQELETHYIQKFNSIETGYNAVCDNGMDSYQEISDSQKEEIARKRVDGFSNIEIAAMYNISMSLAQKICCEKGVESRAEGHGNNNPVKVVMYNKSFYPLKVFQRIYEAKNEIDAIRKRNGKAELLAGNFYAGVKSQALKGNLSFESGKSLIFQNNQEHSIPPNRRWGNFITIIPAFPQNVISTNQGKRPLMTFGLSIMENMKKEYNYLLHLLEFFKIELVLGKIIESFLRSFPINLELYFKSIAPENRRQNP